ncbi:acyltransferase domain-containing protein [Streptomyces sp. NPDC006476]|uniref:acyltransferase domain-containing protein n=1 Tax=Streptomyces sp. NPDC006476 TaxID=3157175 RepID=UPI0033BF12C7
MLFALQVSLAQVWTDLGIRPAALVGHSIGEVAAACVGGALSLEDGALVAAARSHLIQHELGPGAMTVVELPEEELRNCLTRYEGSASIAAFNSPTSIAVSGTPEAVRELEQELRRADVPTRSLRVERAGHCVLMDPILEPLRERLKDITPLPFRVPLHSTALDGVVDPVTDPDYWVRNLREPVRFAPTIAALVDGGIDTFIELGPHGTLRGVGEETAVTRGVPVHVVNSLQRDVSDTRSLLSSVATLYTTGVPLSLGTLYPSGARLVETPLVRWQKDRYWLDTSKDPQGSTPATAPTVPSEAAAALPEPPAETSAHREPEDIVLGEIAEMLGVPPRSSVPPRVCTTSGWTPCWPSG